MKKESSTELFSLILAILALIGWIKCIIALVSCDFDPSYKAEVLYGIGAVTGLGAILGWFDFGK